MRTRIALSISLMACWGGIYLFAQVREFRPVTQGGFAKSFARRLVELETDG